MYSKLLRAIQFIPSITKIKLRLEDKKKKKKGVKIKIIIDSQSESLVLREPMPCCTITWVFHHCLSTWRKICGLCFLHFNAINISFFFFNKKLSH